MNEQQMKDLITGLGAIAEMSSIYYQNLVKNGIRGTEAVLLTGEFLKILMDTTRKGEGK